jgi:hypothetical protein
MFICMEFHPEIVACRIGNPIKHDRQDYDLFVWECVGSTNFISAKSVAEAIKIMEENCPMRESCFSVSVGGKDNELPTKDLVQLMEDGKDQKEERCSENQKT